MTGVSSSKSENFINTWISRAWYVYSFIHPHFWAWPGVRSSRKIKLVFPNKTQVLVDWKKTGRPSWLPPEREEIKECENWGTVEVVRKGTTVRTDSVCEKAFENCDWRDTHGQSFIQRKWKWNSQVTRVREAISLLSLSWTGTCTYLSWIMNLHFRVHRAPSFHQKQRSHCYLSLFPSIPPISLGPPSWQCQTYNQWWEPEEARIADLCLRL